MARILVLDDEKDACDLIERILSRDHSVITFTDEDAAIRYVRENEVDLGILDLKLKKMSGVDVLTVFREVRPEVRVIMLTGYPTLKTAERAITLGAYDYLTKPIDVEHLEAKVKEVMAPQERLRGKKGEDLAEDLSPSE